MYSDKKKCLDCYWYDQCEHISPCEDYTDITDDWTDEEQYYHMILVENAEEYEMIIHDYQG